MSYRNPAARVSNLDDDSSSHSRERTPPHRETDKHNHDVGKFSSTATYIKTIICLASTLTIACWVGFGLILSTRDETPEYLSSRRDGIQLNFSIPDTVAEFLLFIASLLVTLCSDGLGYVHATSLRWALYRERRLEYNTNFRLFTSAKSSFPNRWFMNLISAASLVLCYASVSMLLIGFVESQLAVPDERNSSYHSVNIIALGFLGLGFCGQIATGMLCLRHHQHLIPSWSSNTLWNTMIAQREDAIKPQPGRCMLSVIERDMPSQSRRPLSSKQLLWRIRSTQWIALFIWGLCLSSFVWPILVIYTHTPDSGPYHELPEFFAFSWTPTHKGYEVGLVQFALDGSGHKQFQRAAGGCTSVYQYILCLLVLSFFQGAQALGLHCVELLVNMSRDEQIWRKANLACGSAPAAAPPLFAALSSWRTVVLTTLKALLHWLIGQGLTPSFSHASYGDSSGQAIVYLTMSASRLLVFAIATLILALFTTTLAFWPLRGSQPAAWGHLQTLADLIDDWGEPADTLWWGDKGVNENETRHAGTATRKDLVGEIEKNAWYNGR